MRPFILFAAGADRSLRSIFGIIYPIELDRLDHLGARHEYRAGRCEKKQLPAPSGILDQIMLTPGNGAGGEGIGDEKSLKLGLDYE